MPFSPQDARRWINEHLAHKRPELVPDYDAMVTACEVASAKGVKCDVEDLGPLCNGIVHPQAKIWRDAVALARFLSLRDGPVFDILQRVTAHPKAARRQRFFQCIDYKSVRERTLVLLDLMTKDKAVDSRISAYWTLVQFEQERLKPKLAAYRESEINEKCLNELDQVEKLVDRGYLLKDLDYEWLTTKRIVFTAFCRHGLFSISMDEDDFKATSIDSLKSRCWNAQG
ncbi:MAG: hypothetical protein U0930_22860 [Pirellulales bacterium]